jgi:hypothetical protein
MDTKGWDKLHPLLFVVGETRMKVKTLDIKDSSGTALAKVAVKHRQNKIKGMYDNSVRTPAAVLKAKHRFNFDKEYKHYIEDNYGDVLSKSDKKKLKELVEEHVEEGCVENVVDLHRHIKVIGIREGILFD